MLFKTKNLLAGFTMIEILIVIAIIAILVAISSYSFISLGKQIQLNNATEGAISALKTAQTKTISGENASQWGVYFSTSSYPNQYILFSGQNYANRDPSFDKVYEIPEAVEIYEIDFDGSNEVVFERITGFASTTKTLLKISLRLKNDYSMNRTIYIYRTGQIE